MAVISRPIALSAGIYCSNQNSSPSYPRFSFTILTFCSPFPSSRFFETFSFLPALTDGEITKQVDYIVRNGWTPCLEFSAPETAYIASTNCIRMGEATVNYYDNRYWSMWKLPMFGCTDGSQVLKEIQACTKAFPDAYIRLVAFDNVKQVQCAGFLVHRPTTAKEYQPVDKRSL